MLCVSAGLAHKNLPRLLDAFAPVTRERDAMLVLAGHDGLERQALQDRAAALGISERVRLTGWIGRPELEGLYNAARAFAYPSMIEGFGIPILEAMARGPPGRVLERRRARRGRAGGAAVLFEPRDTGAITETIRRLLDDAPAARAHDRSRLGPGTGVQLGALRGADTRGVPARPRTRNASSRSANLAPEADGVRAAAHTSTATSQRIEVIALAVVVCALIFELVRRRRLMERYALLWLLAGITVLVLALWKGLLTKLSNAVGIYYPPSFLFAVTFVFVLSDAAALLHHDLPAVRSEQGRWRSASRVLRARAAARGAGLRAGCRARAVGDLNVPSDALAVVVVAHDSARHLPVLLDAVHAQLRAGDEFVIVDNASTDGSAELAQRAGVMTIAERENEGFGAGCHAGAAATASPLLLFLNPDAVPQPGCLEALRDAATTPAWIGAPGRRRCCYPTARSTPTAASSTTSGSAGLGTAGSRSRRWAPDPHEVAFLSGAALVVRRADVG